MKLDKNYWESKWDSKQTGWDIGYVSTPISKYIDQLKDKEIKILIPGAGNSYEGEYLWKHGFKNTFLLDYSGMPFKDFLKRCPDFPQEQLITGDFFDHEGHYDLIIEQTFFCALNPKLRSNYVSKMVELLKDKGKIAGLLFNVDFGNDHPPFGGSKEEYLKTFNPYFSIKTMEESYNSIPERQGAELFIELLRK